MFIGKVSELTGATRKAIRHYESIGLIRSPNRIGSYRVYDEHDVQIVSMILRAQELGFSLSELKEIVAKKTRDKKLPLNLVSAMVSDKTLELTNQANTLLDTVRDLEKFKSDVLNNFS